MSTNAEMLEDIIHEFLDTQDEESDAKIKEIKKEFYEERKKTHMYIYESLDLSQYELCNLYHKKLLIADAILYEIETEIEMFANEKNKKNYQRTKQYHEQELESQKKKNPKLPKQYHFEEELIHSQIKKALFAYEDSMYHEKECEFLCERLLIPLVSLITSLQREPLSWNFVEGNNEPEIDTIKTGEWLKINISIDYPFIQSFLLILEQFLKYYSFDEKVITPSFPTKKLIYIEHKNYFLS